MKVAAIYGSERKGSTYHIARQFIHALGCENTITEFFLPKDMDQFCIGCCNCFSRGEQYCPHYAQVEPIRQAIEAADLVIFTTPVYALRVSGQMKALLDHLAFQFMTHRPNESMFSKTALIISTGAGVSGKPAMKDISTSLRFWGVAKTYTYGKAVFASEWDGVSEKSKTQIAKNVQVLSSKILRKAGRAKPGIITKSLFAMFRVFHRKWAFCPYDVAYWKQKGWLKKTRPWKS